MFGIRTIALAGLLVLGGIAGPLHAGAVRAQVEAPTLSTQELMRATALDEIFSQFGPVIEAAPADQAVPLSTAMEDVWGDATRQVFVAGRMHGALAVTLDGKFSAEDHATFAAFFTSAFGEKITGIERAVTLLGPESQLAAREVGLQLATDDTTRRSAQIDEMLRHVSAEIATAMVRQSVRGMMIGMSMSEQRGDIEVPWDDIDAHIDAMMPDIAADVTATQRAMMFYAYRDLTEAELDGYLDFLRTDAARKFYAIAAFAVGEIIAERMHAFGETLAVMLGRVNV